MPDDGGPDVVVNSCEAMFGEQYKGQYEIKFTDDFWRKLYAGLAMQALMFHKTGDSPVYMLPPDVARRAYEQADAMITHKKNTEADGETDNERG